MLLSGVTISSHLVGEPTAGSSQAPATDTSQAWEATPQSVPAGTQVEWQTSRKESKAQGDCTARNCGYLSLWPSANQSFCRRGATFPTGPFLSLLLSSLPSHPLISTLPPFPLPLPPCDQVYGIPCPLSATPTGPTFSSQFSSDSVHPG